MLSLPFAMRSWHETQNTALTPTQPYPALPSQRPREGTPRQPDPTPPRFGPIRPIEFPTHHTHNLSLSRRGGLVTWVMTRVTRAVPNWNANSSSTTETRAYTAKAAITSHVTDPLTTLRAVMIRDFRPPWCSAASSTAELFESKTWYLVQRQEREEPATAGGKGRHQHSEANEINSTF